MSNITQEEIKTALQFAVLLLTAIRASGPQGLPSGHLYATVCGSVTQEYYNGAIRLLKEKNLITEDGYHVLKVKS